MEARKRLSSKSIESSRRPAAQPAGRVPKTRKFRPGTVALREVKRYQKSSSPLLAFSPFTRLVRDISESIAPGTRFQGQALQALQEAAESYLVGIFADSQLCAIHAGRVTLTLKDWRLAMRLRGEWCRDFRDLQPKCGYERYFQLPPGGMRGTNIARMREAMVQARLW